MTGLIQNDLGIGKRYPLKVILCTICLQKAVKTDLWLLMIEDKNSMDISTALDAQCTIKLSLKYNIVFIDHFSIVDYCRNSRQRIAIPLTMSSLDRTALTWHLSQTLLHSHSPFQGTLAVWWGAKTAETNS